MIKHHENYVFFFVSFEFPNLTTSAQDFTTLPTRMVDELRDLIFLPQTLFALSILPNIDFDSSIFVI